MGYYIEVPVPKGKAEQIIHLYGGHTVPSLPAWEEIPQDQALIVVVDNGLFEAAGYAYDQQEYEAFTREDDPRPRQFLLMDRVRADQLTGRVRS